MTRRKRCFDLSRSVELHTRSTAATGETAVSGRTSGLLGPGGTLMRDVFEFAAPCGMLGVLAERLVLTSYLRRLLTERNREIKAVAESDAWREFV